MARRKPKPGCWRAYALLQGKVSDVAAGMRLHSLRASGDFEEYMAFHQRQERQRNYVSAPQNDDI